MSDKQIRWSPRENREDHMIFDSLREADEWGDSIRQDILCGAFDGYETLDQKVAFTLSYYLAESDEVIVHAKKSWENGAFIYRVWVDRITYA